MTFDGSLGKLGSHRREQLSRTNGQIAERSDQPSPTRRLGRAEERSFELTRLCRK
jgi:hypothetical protein